MKFLFGFCVYMIVFLGFCFGQKHTYSSIPRKYNKYYIRTDVPSSISKNIVTVTKYIPKNDLSSDVTQYLQKALDQNKYVKFPAGKYLVSGLKVRSNSVIVFDSGAVLKLIPSQRERYEVLALVGVENVAIYNPIIVGDLKDRKTLKGEWGFGIDIRGSRNIQIFSPKISDCLGDGIVISKSNKGIGGAAQQLFETSQIVINNAFIDYMGRNGISIIGVNDLKIRNPIISNIFSRSPMSAIDIEPDNASYKLDNIKISSPFTYNNGDGIMISLRNFISKNTKVVNILINDHVDVGSTYPLNFPEFRTNKTGVPLQGKIIINNPTWINNNNSMVRGISYGLSNEIIINNPKQVDLRLKSWKGKNVQMLNDTEKLNLHIKDNYNFNLNKKEK